ncbi:chloride channel protein [Methanoculleus sp. FWC-SCC1]|uniref:Chloride channel protein n=1 Tax=Methanoculleus frigidifontis TaxID=2584085 RepID=A0ABT8MCV3_9EURY|nr:chloride channel protein [Methanoculleus sp. FWC-SCC1]MDN7025777.1 chloride channel protein [Methanoculleus sp. FWC-SCC1]
MTPHRDGSSVRFVIVAVLLALAAAGAMVVFLEVQYTGEALFWPKTPPVPFFTLILTTVGGLAVGLCLHVFGDHVQLLQQALTEFRKTGRFEPRHLPAGLLAIYLSLVFGASLGPEVAAIDLGGSMGTLAGDRLKHEVRRLATVGIVGSLIGFGVYLGLTRTTGGALYPLPPMGEILPLYLLYAAVLGLVGAGAGVLFIAAFHLFSRMMEPLAGQYLVRGAAGGIGLGIAATAFPLVLFSGQNEFVTVLETGVAAGAVALLLLAAAKILASTWCMATVFKGGPVFPLIFAGGTLGVAVSVLFPFIPPAVAVPAVMAGMIICVLKMPAVVIPIVALVFLQWEILIVVTVAAVAGYYATRSVMMFPPESEGEGAG